MRAIILTFLIAMTLIACHRSSTNVDILKIELSKLDLKNPENDLQKNIENGDTRFIGIYGYTLSCPGAIELGGKYYPHGIKPIAGTSDAIESDEHSRLIATSAEYATRYNQALTKILYRDFKPE